MELIIPLKYILLLLFTVTSCIILFCKNNNHFNISQIKTQINIKEKSMKKKKVRNKKYNKKSSHSYVNLSEIWLDLYARHSFNKQMITSKGEKKTHIAFNRLLLLYLKECEGKQYIPSKDVIETTASQLFEAASRKVILTDIEPDRMESEFVIHAVKSAKTESRVVTIEGEKEYKLLDVYLVLDCKIMSQDETNLIIKYLRANFDSDTDYLSFLALKLRVKGYPTESKMNSLKKLLIDNVLSVIKIEFEKLGREFKWEETLTQKIKRKVKIKML